MYAWVFVCMHPLCIWPLDFAVQLNEVDFSTLVKGQHLLPGVYECLDDGNQLAAGCDYIGLSW